MESRNKILNFIDKVKPDFKEFFNEIKKEFDIVDKCYSDNSTNDNKNKEYPSNDTSNTDIVNNIKKSYIENKYYKDNDGNENKMLIVVDDNNVKKKFFKIGKTWFTESELTS